MKKPAISGDKGSRETNAISGQLNGTCGMSAERVLFLGSPSVSLETQPLPKARHTPVKSEQSRVSGRPSPGLSVCVPWSKSFTHWCAPLVAQVHVRFLLPLLCRLPLCRGKNQVLPPPASSQPEGTVCLSSDLGRVSKTLMSRRCGLRELPAVRRQGRGVAGAEPSLHPPCFERT